MAVEIEPHLASSRKLTGRTPLSLMSNSTRFSQVDCMRSISNGSIFKVPSRRQYSAMYRSSTPRPVKSQTVMPAGSTATGRLAELADLDGAVPLIRGVLQFTQLLTLTARIDQQRGGAAQDIAGSSSCLPGESEPTAEMWVPGCMSRAWSRGWREAVAVTIEAGARGDVGGRVGDRDFGIAAELRGDRGGSASARSGDCGPRCTMPVEVAGFRRAVRAQQARLNAGAEDAEDAVAAAEFARDHGGDSGGAHVGEMAGVGEEGDGLAGFRGGEQHHAVARRQSAREVAGKVAAILRAK